MTKKQPGFDISEIQARIAAGDVVDVSAAKTAEEAQEILDEAQEMADEAESIARSKLMREDTEEGLVAYEQYAVEGLVEMIPEWSAEVGLGGVIRTLYDMLLEIDKKAKEADDALPNGDDELCSAQRRAAAEHIRLMYQMSRPGMSDVLKMLESEKAKSLT